MFNWLRELLEIRHEFRERKYKLLRESNETVCNTCEVLKVALERANYEKEHLMNRILNPIKEIEARPQFSDPKIALPNKNMMPWRVQQQMLEAEDRKKAQILKNAPKPSESISIEDLEKEMDNAGSERESSKGIQ